MGVVVPRPLDTKRVNFAQAPTILVVDDDSALLNALTFGIELEGYRVLAFSSAEAVLNSSSVPEIACIVVDHRLPGLDGLFLVEVMRARGLTVPAILMTSHPARRLRVRCSGLNIPIVEKPLLRDELSLAIRAAMGA